MCPGSLKIRASAIPNGPSLNWFFLCWRWRSLIAIGPTPILVAESSKKQSRSRIWTEQSVPPPLRTFRHMV